VVKELLIIYVTLPPQNYPFLCTMLFAIQITAIIIGLLAICLFTKSNFTIMKFRQLTAWGKMQLWTGTINMQELVKQKAVANNLVEKELMKAIILYERAKIIGYVCIFINVIALGIALVK